MAEVNFGTLVTTLLVKGYLQESHQELFAHLNKSYYNFPTAILCFVMLYVGNAETFSTCGDDMKISSKDGGLNNVLTMFSKGWNTGFGTVPVTINAQTTGTYEWYLTSDATIIVVGISELDERAQNQYGFPFGRKWKCYGMTELHAFQVTEVWDLTGKRCIEKRQNSIKLRLDCATRCMDFTVNGAHFCRLTDVADGEYRLAVTLSGAGACAHIQTFDRGLKQKWKRVEV